MIDKKDWQEFKKTGLLLFINQILHAFGWAICFEYDVDKQLTKVYPARVKFRGFDNKNVTDSYIKISEYMEENAIQLLKEAKE